MNEIEYILCAAIWYKNIPKKKEFEHNVNPINCGNTGLVFCGHRHPHCMYTMSSVTGLKSVEPEVGAYIQGFLTNKNRFVDRSDAAEIAYKAGQIKQPTTSLFSEDLY